MANKFAVLVLMGVAAFLGGCFEFEAHTVDNGAAPPSDNGAAPPPPAAQNAAPTITGSPPANVLEGELYDFMPSASDPDGDKLQYSISRKPAWASFNPSTGRIWGTPDAADVGNFTNIAIAVSDGQATVALTDFNISVNPIAVGQLTLSWIPPTQNEDGSTLDSLSGYRIYYGRDQNNLTQVTVLNNPGLTRYVVENLSPARWYFAVTSVNAQGAESGRSALVSKTIS